MKNNKNKISVLFSRGFEPKNNAKTRIKMALQQKVEAPRMNLRWVLVLGGILLLIGLSVYKKNTEVQYLGPAAMVSIFGENSFTGQNYGESGPRGLETNQNYVHFQ